MKKRNIAIILNILFIIVELISFGIIVGQMHRIGFEYYTEESNLIALLVAIVYLIYLLKNKGIPKWLCYLKYIANVNLTITLLVVIFILIPTYDFDVYGLLIKDGMKYHHLICPLISLTSFLFFERLGRFSKKDVFVGLSLTFIYAVVIILSNIFGIIEGPYKFLLIKEQTLIASIGWFVLIIGFAFIIASTLRVLYNKFNK